MVLRRITVCRQWLGAVLDVIKGPSRTYVYQGHTEYMTERVRPAGVPAHVDLGLECRRIVYRTEYKRWWIPNSTNTVYEVQGYAPEAYADEYGLNPNILEKVTYPLLCTKLLEWTPFPLYYAMRAYLERLS